MGRGRFLGDLPSANIVRKSLLPKLFEHVIVLTPVIGRAIRRQNGIISSTLQASIRVEPLSLKHDRVNWEEMTQKPFLTVTEVCLVPNVRVETLRRWIKEGIVRTKRVGKKHLISREILLYSNNQFVV